MLLLPLLYGLSTEPRYSLFDWILRPAPWDGGHIWHCQWTQGPVARWAMGPRENLPPLFCWMDVAIKWRLMTYCHTHRLEHCSALLTAAPCSDGEPSAGTHSWQTRRRKRKRGYKVCSTLIRRFIPHPPPQCPGIYMEEGAETSWSQRGWVKSGQRPYQPHRDCV